MNTTLKILVVEDDALIGADIARTLTSFGYTVTGPISTGEEVLERIEILQPNFILMDIKLKGKLDGIQTAEAIQQKVALPVVFLTGLTDEESFQRAKLLNPYGYLIKPFEAHELRTTIELTLHRFYSQTEPSDSEQNFEIDGDRPGLADGDSVNEKDGIISFLSRLPLFVNVPPSEIENLVKGCSIKQFEAGEFICFEGDDVKGGFIPLSGRISIMKTADSGKELIVALLAPGDPFGVQFAVNSFAVSLSARTQIASKVVWIPASQWNAFTKSRPGIDSNINKMLAAQLLTAYGLASSLAHASVEGRVISTLLALFPQIGKAATQADSNSGRIYITRKELAELTGTTPETAYRVTKHLEREKLLDLTRPGIIKIPDVAALRAAARG